MPNWNPFFWLSPRFRSSTRNPSSSDPVRSNNGGGVYLGQRVFGVDGMMDLQHNIADTLTRVDGEGGEAFFDGNLSNIVEFVDRVLELLVSLHDKGLVHGNLIEGYIMRSIPASTSTGRRSSVNYYFVGFREDQWFPYAPDTPWTRSTEYISTGQASINGAYLAFRFDVGCVGEIFERMFYMVRDFPFRPIPIS
ncbi:hypothetical protein BDM02DRAFT_888090 [Thelephora ganbajun]|uniref:Uncharacterized protein n=1 Tax=Thelephora ganbajun TaxID=370292 RepID=A0ACB6Z4U3_THEGA|nr:hypothetical protein BDM02DRAFT_888090 [Thelephora ganbajun]